MATLRSATLASIGVAGFGLMVSFVSPGNDRVNALNAALSAGADIVMRDRDKYLIECTEPGKANAVLIAINDKGERVLTEPLLSAPIPAVRCASRRPTNG